MTSIKGIAMKKHLLALVAALFGTAALAGAEPPPVLPPNLAVDINAPGAVRAEIAISIPSLKEEQRYELKVSEGGLVGGVYVPPGKENRVSVTAFDAKGEKVYWGSGYLSVSTKLNPQIDIALAGKETKEPLTAKFGTYRLGLALAANAGDGLMVEASLFDATGKHLPLSPEDVMWGGLPEKFEVLQYSCFGGSLCVEYPDPRVYEAMIVCMRDVVCSHKKPKDSRGPYRYVAVGRNHTCALTVSNDILCWGDNRFGQLRNSSTTCNTAAGPSNCSAFPQPIECGTGEVCKFQSLSAGAERTCAVDTDGKAWCWGSHGEVRTGELASDGYKYRMNGEIQAVDANGNKVLFISIDTDLMDSCAISTTRELYCWGYNQASLDDSDVHNKGTLYNSVSVGKRHSCAQKVGGKLDCWGDNTDGQVTGSFPLPGPVNPELQQIFNRGGHGPAAGATSSCAQDPDDNTICWGSPETALPWATSSTGGFIALWRSYATSLASNSHSCLVSPGTYFPCTRTCATALGGDLFCGNWRWGATPQQLTNLGDPPSEKYVSWNQVDVGPNHVCAVTSQRDIWCFGMNDLGQFGTGTTSNGRTEAPAIAAVRFSNEIATPIFP
jgi:alpha-tubulin suppressor-like RCC1 family protein